MKITLPQVKNCDDCGACCTGQEALPVGYWLGIAKSQQNKLPPELLKELQDMAANFDATGYWPANGEPCVWYDADTKRCKHYEHRPDVCRELAVGSDGCLRWRRSCGIAPAKRFGIRNGKLVELFS